MKSDTLGHDAVSERLVRGGSARAGLASIVRLAGVERRFEQGGSDVFALRDVDLDVRRGEWLTVMGRSGSGKSTLLGILGLQDAGWSGEYWLDGDPVHSLGVEERARRRALAIGFVFQSHQLLEDLTVFENLEVPLAYRDLSKNERLARVAETLDRFGLAARRDLRPRQLSGGQQQLVAIARALVGSPKLVLADEPTGSLHSEQAAEVMEQFRRLHAQGTTIVQVTHDRDVASLSERRVTLRDGWLDATSPR